MLARMWTQGSIYALLVEMQTNPAILEVRVRVSYKTEIDPPCDQLHPDYSWMFTQGTQRQHITEMLAHQCSVQPLSQQLSWGATLGVHQ